MVLIRIVLMLVVILWIANFHRDPLVVAAGLLTIVCIALVCERILREQK